MKKLFYFAAAAVALAACAKNEVVPVNSGENQEITFNVAPKTKATINKFANDLSFKSYAYYLPGEETWDNHTTDPALYINGAEIANTNLMKRMGFGKLRMRTRLIIGLRMDHLLSLLGLVLRKLLVTLILIRFLMLIMSHAQIPQVLKLKTMR